VAGASGVGRNTRSDERPKSHSISGDSCAGMTMGDPLPVACLVYNRFPVRDPESVGDEAERFV
jgi:hypothetical protein